MNKEWQPRPGLAQRILSRLKPRRTPGQVATDLRKAAVRIPPDQGAFSLNLLLTIAGIYDSYPELRGDLSRHLRDIGVRPRELLEVLLSLVERRGYQTGQVVKTIKDDSSLPRILRNSKVRPPDLGQADPIMVAKVRSIFARIPNHQPEQGANGHGQETETVHTTRLPVDL